MKKTSMSSTYDVQRVRGVLLFSTAVLHLVFSSIQSQERRFIPPTSCTWTFCIQHARDFFLVEKSGRHDISRGRIACRTVHAFASFIVECQWGMGMLRERHQFPASILIITLPIFCWTVILSVGIKKKDRKFVGKSRINRIQKQIAKCHLQWSNTRKLKHIRSLYL